MSRKLRPLLAVALIVSLAITLVTASEPEKPKEGQSAKDAAEFLLSLSPGDADVSDIPKLIEQLSDDHFDKREKAARSLEGLGPLAITALHKAKKSKDADLAQRAGPILDAVLLTWMRFDRVWSALRVLRLESDPAAVKAILAVLPVVAPEMELDDFCWLSLEKVVGTKAENLRALDPYLTDRLAARRAAAGCLLARHGTAAQREQARRLLTDPSAEARLRTAQGLLGAGEGAVVPTLIELLNAEPLPLAWQAEELLVWWSDGAGPLERIGTGTAEERKTCQTAWRAWRPPADKLAAERRRFCRPPGLFLAHAQMQRGWRLGVLGCDGQAHWWRETKTYDLFDMHMLPSGNTLLYEKPHHPFQDAEGEPLCLVAERQPDGRLVWGLPGRGSLEAQHFCRRLIWGGTYICGPYGSPRIGYPDNGYSRFTGTEDPQAVSTYSWQLLPDGLGVRMASKTRGGDPQVLCYHMPAAGVVRFRDREFYQRPARKLGQWKGVQLEKEQGKEEESKWDTSGRPTPSLRRWF